MLEITLGPYHRPFRPWTPDQGRVFDGLFAYDTETTLIDDDRPYLVPSLVLATACDGDRGVFIPRRFVGAFLEAHAGLGFIAHNAAFDLKVTQAVVGDHLDVYARVEANLVWDTMILHRLHSLATVGHTARGAAKLEDCTRAHLDLELPKAVTDGEGRDVRTGFGRFLGRPFEEIPEAYLRYAAADPLATWHLFWELNRKIKGVLQAAPGVWGYVDDAWLRDAIRRFGPLTHHIQLRASIITDVLRGNGIAVDAGRGAEKLARVREVMDAAKERLRRRGYLAGEPGNAKSMQSILARFHRDRPEVEARLTESGEMYSTSEEDLAELAAEDGFFADYAIYRATEKLVSTYLDKMGPSRLYPKFNYLVETGRTSCSGFNLQNLPKAKAGEGVADTIRGCFVPAEGMVFIDSDYSQIELVVLGYALDRQFGLGTTLRDLVNQSDVHRLIAAAVLDKDPAEVIKSERDSAKPVSFGRPGGMGAERLRRIAKASYGGLDLTLEEVQGRIEAYHELCPELDAFLTDEVDTGQALAEALHLTPARYYRAIEGYYDTSDPAMHVPAGWLGGMLLKTLRDDEPATRKGRPYSPEEIAFFWDEASRVPLKLKPKLRAKLESRQADRRLWEAVRDWAGRRSVFTVTGRLRARATFCSSRNTIFQAAAADGAIYGLWLVWRAGHQLVDFVHDQSVVEAPADDQVPRLIAENEALMKRGMLMIVPGMNVKVETVVTRSLNKKDLDPRYLPEANPPTPPVVPADEIASCETGVGSPAT